MSDLELRVMDLENDIALLVAHRDAARATLERVAKERDEARREVDALTAERDAALLHVDQLEAERAWQCERADKAEQKWAAAMLRADQNAEDAVRLIADVVDAREERDQAVGAVARARAVVFDEGCRGHESWFCNIGSIRDALTAPADVPVAIIDPGNEAPDTELVFEELDEHGQVREHREASGSPRCHPRWTDGHVTIHAQCVLNEGHGHHRFPTGTPWQFGPAGEIQSYQDSGSPLVSAIDQPRTWELPPEPGPEVTAVRDRYGRVWTRPTPAAWAQSGIEPGWMNWPAMLTQARLTDATGEVAEPLMPPAEHPEHPESEFDSRPASMLRVVKFDPEAEEPSWYAMHRHGQFPAHAHAVANCHGSFHAHDGVATITAPERSTVTGKAGEHLHARPGQPTSDA